MKRLKYFAIALFACFAFVLTGCSSKGQLDTAVKVNTGNETKYVECTEQNSLLTNAQNEDFLQTIMPEATSNTMSVKLSFEADLLVSNLGEGIPPMEAEIDVVCMITSTMVVVGDDVEVVPGLALKADVDFAGEDAELSLYYKDNYLYINSEGQKFKMSVDSLMGGQDGGDLGGESAELPFDSEKVVENLMTEISEIMENVAEFTYTEGDLTRYQLAYGQQKMFVILKDGTLSQIGLELENINFNDIIEAIIPELASEIPFELTATELDLGLELGTKEIDYPSLKGYEDMSSVMGE